MSEAADAPFTCRNCGRAVTGEAPDHHGWCHACKAVVVRRSTAWAVLPALVMALLYVWLIVATEMYESRFMIVWIALGVALTWLAFKIARRVLFDVIRNRGVPPPKG